MIEYLLSLSLLIAVVLLIRAVFRKTVSPRVTYALWLLVVIRMMVPVTLFEADVTLYNYLQNWQTEQAEQTEEMPEDSEVVSEENVQSPGTELPQTTPTYPSQNTTPVTPAYPPSTPFIPTTPTVPGDIPPVVPIVPETEAEPPILSEDVIPEVPEEPAIIHWQRIANLVWFIGAAVIALWLLCTAVTYNRRLVRNRILHRTVRGTKVYISEDASVPCISGLIPSIYITPEAANSKSEMLIIIHEHVHLRHGDHIWAFIRALALIVFWYNPLVWAAATVSKLDAELACDDAISAKLNDAARLKYAHILLDTIPQKHRYATGLGSAPMKERILMLTKRQKNRGICLILALVLAVSAVGCSFIGSRKITMDRIQEQNGFTILSQETKEKTLILPPEQLPTYDDIVSAEGACLELEDIPVFTTDTTEVFLHTVGVSAHEPEGTGKDKLYLGFDIRHNLTDSGTVYTVNRVMNEDGSNTYSPEVSVTEETLEEYDRKILHMGSGPNDQFYLYIDADLYTALRGDVSIGITLNEIVYERGSEVKTYGFWKGENQQEDSGSSAYLEIPEITLTPVDALPKGAAEALFQASPIGWDPTFLVFEDGLTFYLRRYYGLDPEESCYKSTLTLPEGFSNGRLIHASRGGGSGEVDLLVKAENQGKEVYLWYFFRCSDYSTIVTPPQAAMVIPEQEVPYLLETIPSTEQKKSLQGPFIGYVADKETPWIRLYTEKDGIYIGRIPYEIFHDWVATDRDGEGWSPGWQPEYMHFYYAEFDDFRWAAAHLTNTVMGSGRKNVATSTDGGDTWNVGSTADDYGGNHVVGIGFASESIAFMSFDPYNEHDGADGPIISRTIDGGKTWELLDIPLQESQTGTKLISGTPFYDGDLLRYPVWLNPSHGTKEGAVMYLISLDCGLTWEWEKQNSNISKGDTLSAYRNDNPGNGFVYEGYTVEYECESPYGGKFDFHIHLPQLNSDTPNAQKWNTLYQEYENEFGEQLRRTVQGTNTEYYAHITYDTVTTGDVLTIYIVKSHGILASGASTMDYDIYHYNTKEDRFLSTDEFLAYYAEGQFADYTVADIVKFMNEHTFTTDEGGSPYLLTEENILGVIPSVFGDGKFDVVYQGFSIEGRFATRMLFSPYPTYTSDAVYTYRLTYHDYVDCDDKEIYGTPAGYRLLINQRVIGEYDTGYYVDCLLTEDIAEPPESYSLSEHGGYYTPVQEDPYGNMYIVVDHETDWGHLNAWIPFDMPDTAQDYYWGIHNKYFSYDRILNGTNYQVNQNIAEQVGQVFDAYRNGKDPNELFPASKTEYTPYPMVTIRENPTHEEIGEILKNTSVGESGIINFSIDLGDGWRMALPMDIAGFGDGAQAYFTGVYYAHGTPKEEEDIEWTQYSETRTGEDGNIYQISFVLPVEWMHGSGGILNDANGKKRIGSRYIAVNRSKEDFVSSLEEMAEQYHVDLDSPLTGTSDSGISYMGYCFEGEREIPGDITGRYLYRFAYSDSISLQMDVWKRNAYDDDGFYEQYVLPIIQSVTIRELSTETILASILENKQYFYDVSSKENMLLSEYKAETDYSVKKYTILDLNDDREPEMVLWLGHGTDDYVGFLVLHRDGNTVYAHGFPYRGFNGLNGDGVYTSSSSAFNISILKLDFDGDTCTETVMARREGDGSPESVTYYIEDRIGTAEEFEKCLSRYNSRGIPDWYSYDIEEITDIDDWHTLLWAEGLPDDENRQPSQNVYSFIRELVKGESDIPEINGLGIKDYSIELLKDSAYDSLFRFTFTVTGNSLPQTLLPGTYTWMLLDGMELSIYTEGIPATQEEVEAYWKRMRGLDRFEGNSAVDAVNMYLSWMPYIYEVSPYGEWDPENYHLPYNYICAHYGNETLEISFDKLQSLMTEKFGITVDRPNENRLLSRCEYNKETDTVRYADTRGYSAVHRILDIREEDGITYVIVQLFADRHRMIPSHKLQFAIGEGEVFLRSEIIQNGNYDPREIS